MEVAWEGWTSRCVGRMTGVASSGSDRHGVGFVFNRLPDLRVLAGVAVLLLASCTKGMQAAPEAMYASMAAPEPSPTAAVVIEMDEGVIAGHVIDESGPVARAVIRIQSTDRQTQSDAHGAFAIAVNGSPTKTVNLTGWAEGYFCAGPVPVAPGEQDVVIELHAHSDRDNREYIWLPSFSQSGKGEAQGCAECHSRAGTDLEISLPVDEWVLDAHAHSATNLRFLTMYNGTNLLGEQSPPTRYGYNRDYGSFPLPPNPNQPYFGPGYKLDFPETMGNCGACHLPAAAIDDPYGVDPNQVTGVESEGVPCDFCHKVWNVNLDPECGLPYTNMPGVLSMSFRRPFEGHQFFTGPYDDVAPGEDTYSELQTESAFCAGCHFGVFWDTVIYNSFGEWLQSAYSDPSSGQTCQDCHMPHTGAEQFAATAAGGLARDPNTIFSHRMLGSTDLEFLREGLAFDATAVRSDATVQVEVELINDNTGHKFPTDSPLRQLILVVEVRDEQGVALDQVDGPTVPAWAGVGEEERGYYGDLPGSGYALILREIWTGISPSGAYWNPTQVVEDTRLEPFETVRTAYAFNAAGHEGLTVSVQLFYRRAFIELSDQKSWENEDLILYEETISLTN